MSQAIVPGGAKTAAKVLVVDDEERNRRLLGTMLQAEGYDAMEAVDGPSALEMARAESPDLILLDVMMPGMDGYEVARRLKEDPATHSVPIVIVTSLDDRESRLRGLEAGAEEFVTKPVDRSELRVRVRNLLRLKEYGDFLADHNRTLDAQVKERTAELRQLSHRLFETEENERRRIARELHDRIGGNVTALALTLGMARSALPADARDKVSAHLGEFESLLQSTAELVRDVMADLRPPGLDELGLVPALSGYARAVTARSRVPIRVSQAGSMPRLPLATELTLFRIAQEALTNAIKHAGATEVGVTLVPGPATLVMTIADNGSGFDPQAPRSYARSHLGLVNMRERADSVGGALRIEAAPGQGTRVIVEVKRVTPSNDASGNALCR